jgi:hypothetical protein
MENTIYAWWKTPDVLWKTIDGLCIMENTIYALWNDLDVLRVMFFT